MLLLSPPTSSTMGPLPFRVAGCGASVTVACYEINVTKDAATSYTRTFHWTIDKYSTDPNGGALTLKPGEIYVDYPYKIKVDLADPAYRDVEVIRLVDAKKYGLDLTKYKLTD